MNIDQLKALANDRPFRPLVLETIGGNRIGVPGAGAIVFSPSDLPYKFDLIFIYASDGLVHHITAEGINRLWMLDAK